MANLTYRGVIRDGVVVLQPSASSLGEGTEVEVRPVNLLEDMCDLIEAAEKPVAGTPSAVLAAVEAAPHVPTDWVNDLEQLIDQGRRPPTRVNPFAENT